MANNQNDDPGGPAPGEGSPKKPYERPAATVVPLKMEERVLTCSKAVSPCYSANIGAS
jgi:hypothetical protein